jgi:nitrite reductase/ring-hydroxylating ferredoxin subunit
MSAVKHPPAARRAGRSATGADRFARAGRGVSIQIAPAVADREWPVLDRLANRTQPIIRSVIDRYRGVADVLDGVWQSVPLHPAVTDLPLGAALTATLLDGFAAMTGSKDADGHADAALKVAVLGSAGAAVTGLAEWRWIRGGERRAASVHGLMNVAGVALNVGSLGARHAGRRGLGRTLSLTGMLVFGLAAHLGGELSYGMGIRVDPNPPMPEADGRVASLAASELADGRLRGVEVGGERVVVARCDSGAVCAIAATCSHLGGPLDEGSREGDTVVCPWHGSRFDLRSGAVIGGPAVFAQPRYTATERDGRVEIRLAGGPRPFYVTAGAQDGERVRPPHGA